jgi:hypothetical protein
MEVRCFLKGAINLNLEVEFAPKELSLIGGGEAHSAL